LQSYFARAATRSLQRLRLSTFVFPASASAIRTLYGRLSGPLPPSFRGREAEPGIQSADVSPVRTPGAPASITSESSHSPAPPLWTPGSAPRSRSDDRVGYCGADGGRCEAIRHKRPAAAANLPPCGGNVRQDRGGRCPATADGWTECRPSGIVTR
jgi:hypothetical protein